METLFYLSMAVNFTVGNHFSASAYHGKQNTDSQSAGNRISTAPTGNPQSKAP